MPHVGNYEQKMNQNSSKSIGQIIQINSNLAIVDINDKQLTCKIRGLLKYNQDSKPIVGDFVEIISVNNELVIRNILERKSHIIRPNVANIDVVVLVQSIIEPKFNFHLMMKYLAYYESFIGEVLIVFTKQDLITQAQSNEFEKYLEIFKNNGYDIFCLPNKNEFSRLQGLLENKTFCLAGNSGVGKTTITNQLFPHLNLKTQEISHALNRGKHTTTTATLIKEQNYKLIDTPGFSSIDINLLTKQELAKSYHDFKQISLQCKYSNCLHINEPYCAIKKAVENNEINLLRYQQYLEISKEINK